ncbi:Na+/H+ antiporter subunit E [bacterium]|nr:Na+/H+ antiporter subunit E [bacterium]
MISLLILRFVIFFLIYLALAGSLDMQEIVAAGVISLLLVWITRQSARSEGRMRLSIKMIMAAIIFPLVFLKALLLANLDVASRVLRPSLPIKPGIVKVKIKLKSPMGRLVLANSITLTPGTLTVESSEEYFYIHWVDVKDGSVAAATESIVKEFEKYLEVLFG